MRLGPLDCFVTPFALSLKPILQPRKISFFGSRPFERERMAQHFGGFIHRFEFRPLNFDHLGQSLVEPLFYSMSDNHPYKTQPAKAFWRQTVSNSHFLNIPEWYTKKWPITNARIATAGSCFAQHIGTDLRLRGFKYVDVDPLERF